MQHLPFISARRPVCFLLALFIMFSVVVKGFKVLAPLNNNKNLVFRSLATRALKFDNYRSSRDGGGRDYDRGRDRNFGGKRGGGGGGGGSKSRNRPSDPFAQLSFQRTIKIDPDMKTPIDQMNLSAVTKDVLVKKGFTEMTPVQSQSYQEVFEGRDVVARSRTGTGKTFAFGLPLIEKLVANNVQNIRSRELPVILILEPTRELAMQVAQELGSILRPHRLKIAAIYGGVSFSKQQYSIQDGVHIVVGTPGRILDHISRGTVDFSNVKHVVLDEGDTMLEMGFQKAVETILMSVKAPGDKARELATQSLSSFSFEEEEEFEEDEEEFLEDVKQGKAANSRANDVQMLLFSATMPAWICKLTDKLMRNPVFLDAVQEGETRLASTIKHFAIPLPVTAQSGGPAARIQAISGVLEDIIMSKGKGGQCIVFTNFKDDCDALVGSKAFSRLRSTTLHGDISQQQRSETLRAFKEKRIDVLVATDVAARGLDIAGVDLVVHTALPNDPDSYVHRSGRTGRAGRPGTAVVLYTADEVNKMESYQRSLMFQFEHIGLPKVSDVVKSYVDISEERVRRVSSELASHFLPHARALLLKAEAGELAVHDDEIDVVDSDDLDSDENQRSVGVPLQQDELVARLLAAMTNRKEFSARSMLTGEEDKVTLSIRVTPKSAEPPSTIADFQKLVGNFLTKKLEITDFRFRKTMIGQLDRSEVRGDADRTVFLQDFDSDIAEDILKKMADITVVGLTIERCQKLPRMVNDRSSGRGGYGGGGGYGGDRRDRDRGRDRFGGGDRRSYNNNGGGRRENGRGGDSERRSWQSSR